MVDNCSFSKGVFLLHLKCISSGIEGITIKILIEKNSQEIMKTLENVYEDKASYF